MRGRHRAVRINIDKAHLGILTGQWGAVTKLQRLCLMHRRILFKLCVSVVVSVAVVLFYLVNMQEDRTKSGGRAYRKLVLGSSSDFSSSHLSHQLRQKSDQEFLNKHVEAIRIHTQLSSTRSTRDIHDSDKVLQPPVQAKANDGLFEDKLGPMPEKLKKEPIHLLGGFGQYTGEKAKNVSGSKGNSIKHEELILNRKVNHSVLDHPGKEHDFRFESEHLDANIKRLRDSPSQGNPIHLCVVVCGTRTQETMTMLKSASMVTPLNVSFVFHIFAEPEIQTFFQDQLDLWPLVQRQRLSYHIYNVTFPDSSTTNAWKKLFKPCASQRLFLPNLLRSVERLVYVDTDTVFLESLEHLWSMFDDFNSTQLAGLVGEAEASFAAWYNRFANHPFYGKFGLNSGVMLMDLGRLRQTSWLSDMQRLFHQYRLSLPWGDQDLINIYFAFHPDQMFLMPCKWNYRNDHCRYTSNCVSAEKNGISVLHGSRRTFESGKEPLLKAIHKAFTKHQLGDDMEFHFLENLEEDVKSLKHKNSNCWKVSEIFLTQLRFLKDRNREFMQATRKASQKLASSRRQLRTGHGSNITNLHQISLRLPQVDQKSQTLSQGKEKKLLAEGVHQGENQPGLQKEKPFYSKDERKEQPIYLSRGGRISESERRGKGEGGMVKPRILSKNVMRLKDESHQVGLEKDKFEHLKPHLAPFKGNNNGGIHFKQDEVANTKMKADNFSAKSLSLSKAEQGLSDMHRDINRNRQSGKSPSRNNLTGGLGHQVGQEEKVARKSALKVEKKTEYKEKHTESEIERRPVRTLVGKFPV